MENKTDSILNSSKWVFGRIILVQSLNLVAISIIARKLTPSEFGLVAIASILITFLNNLVTQGVSQFVIFDKHDNEERLNSAFWLNLFISFFICSLGFFLSPIISNFYNEPDIQIIINLLLLRVPFESVIVIIDASFNKKLQFKILEKRDVFVQFISISISVVMALTGFGIWSLVYPSIISVFIRFLITLYITVWKPKLMFNIIYWKEIFSYSSKIILEGIMNFFITEGDTLIIGKILGSFKLGIYNLSWRSSNLVSRNIVSLVNKMSFPYFAKSSKNYNEILLKINKIFRVLSLITFPLLFLLLVLAEEFILGLYGPQWIESVLPFQILLIYAIRYSVGAPAGSAFKALGRPDISLKIVLSMLPFFIIAIIFGTSYGVVGVALSVTIVRTIFGLLSFVILANILKTTVFMFFNQMKNSFIAAITSSVVVYFTKQQLVNVWDFNQITSFIILFVFGILFYMLLIKMFFKDTSIEVEKIIKKLLQKN